MRTPTLAALIAALLLAGCGGGGGSSPAPAGGSSTQSGSLSTTDIAQMGSSGPFDAVDTGEADAAVISGSVGTSSRARSVQTVSGFACTHRRTRTVTANPDGSTTIETIDYYDNACTQVERDAVAVYASSGGTANITRTVTTYSLTHAQLGVRTQTYVVTGTAGNGSWTVMSTFTPGTSSTPLAQYSHMATVTPSTYVASTGHIFNDAKPSINASYGHSAATNATIATDSSSDTIFTGTRNGVFSKGALDGLTISSSAPFTVAGGTQTGTAAFTGSVGFTSQGVLEAVSISGTLPSGNAVAVTSSADSNGNVTVSGTITSGSTTVATFTTDSNGNGILTITATSTQVPIVDWHVIW
jgi:hypothetical protein